MARAGLRHTRKLDADTLRRRGETGTIERVQLDAVRNWFNVAPALWR